jgi:hypothetical protein
MQIDLETKQLGAKGDRGIHIGDDVSHRDLVHACTSCRVARPN